MKTIYKYILAEDIQDVVDYKTLWIPAGYIIRSVGLQGRSLCAWAEVDTEQPPVKVEFHVVGTGNPINEVRSRQYVGTVNYGSTLPFPFVIHIYKLTDI